MSNTAKFLIKIAAVCAIYIPIKFTIMAGRKSSFLEDFMVAFFAFAIGHAVIYFIERNQANKE